MSHFTEIKVDFDQKYEKELIAALEEYFGEGKIEVHENGEYLKTYMGQSAKNSGLGHTEKCHLIVRRKTQEERAGHAIATNDAGYERNGTGKYNAYFDSAGFSNKAQGLVAQSYALKVAEKKLKAEGYMTTRVAKADGTIRLEARIYQ